MSIWSRKKPSFGFISTRFEGLDGVSLEARKWVDVLQFMGCPVYFMAGELDTDHTVSYLAPRAHFQHADILEVQHALFVEKKRTPALTRRIFELKEALKADIQAFYKQFQFKILVVQNALAIPVNIPLGLAITEFIAENQIPCIAHHHDFYWERDRFNSHVAIDYLRAAFPPVDPNIQHVVINSLAGHELGLRTGAPWTLIPNVFDFKTLPSEKDDYNRHFKQAIGLDENTFLLLQPTRIVSRKGIEIAAELLKRLNFSKASLVVTHKAGDEGVDYLMRINEFARMIDIDLKIISDQIGTHRGVNSDGKKQFTLWDAYLNADLVVYPSLYEGYGNAFIETIYCRKPIVINRYSIFIADIESKGFDVISFDGFITDQTIREIKELLSDPIRQAQMVEKNYLLGWRYLSYEMLMEKLEQLLINIYGAEKIEFFK